MKCYSDVEVIKKEDEFNTIDADLFMSDDEVAENADENETVENEISD